MMRERQEFKNSTAFKVIATTLDSKNTLTEFKLVTMAILPIAIVTFSTIYYSIRLLRGIHLLRDQKDIEQKKAFAREFEVRRENIKSLMQEEIKSLKTDVFSPLEEDEKRISIDPPLSLSRQEVNLPQIMKLCNLETQLQRLNSYPRLLDDYIQLVKKLLSHDRLKGSTLSYLQIYQNLITQIKWTFAALVSVPSNPYISMEFFLPVLEHEFSFIGKLLAPFRRRKQLLNDPILKKFPMLYTELSKLGRLSLFLHAISTTLPLFLLSFSILCIPLSPLIIFPAESKSTNFPLTSLAALILLGIKLISPTNINNGNLELESSYFEISQNNHKVIEQCAQYEQQHEDTSLQKRLQQETNSIFEQELKKLSNKNELFHRFDDIKEEDYKKTLYKLIPIQAKLLEIDSIFIQINNKTGYHTDTTIAAILGLSTLHRKIVQLKENLNSILDESLQLKKPPTKLETIVSELSSLKAEFQRRPYLTKSKTSLTIFHEPQPLVLASSGAKRESSDIRAILSKMHSTLDELHNLASQLLSMVTINEFPSLTLQGS